MDILNDKIHAKIVWGVIVTMLVVEGNAEEAKRNERRPQALGEMSIEELMQIEVTSVSKKSEKLSGAAAAIYVITDEDIRRSGATSIPEALRMAVGVDVARIDNHSYAIGIRGFNGGLANKLLVLMDGRAIYEPLFAGVFWDRQNYLMADIDRIEVIRGPGGSLWGANAVNGVINIITKSAKHTQGFYVSGGYGTEERGFGDVRYGGKFREDLFYRIYLTGFNRDNLGGGDHAEGWHLTQGGFRMDWEADEANLVTFQGDLYHGRAEQTAASGINQNIGLNGGNWLGRWTHTRAGGSQATLQLYYDYIERPTDSTVDFHRNTGDIDFQYRFELGNRQEIVWGLGYRVSAIETKGLPTISFVPPNRTLHTYSGFVQDEIALIPDRLALTVGTKLEHKTYTGLDIQPNARLAWTPDPRQTVWAAVSRAVRTPSPVDADIVAAGFRIGNPNLHSEELLAYELGYRVRLHDRVTLDLAAFYNVYDNLESLEVVGSPPTSAQFRNKLAGETYGVELTTQVKLTDWWVLRPSYSYLQIQLHGEDETLDTTTEPNTEGSSPHHQFGVGSSINLPGPFELDVWWRYVDSLPALNIPGYMEADVRFGWRPTKNIEISIVGQNLLDHRHPEFRTSGSGAGGRVPEVERSVYGKVTWQF